MPFHGTPADCVRIALFGLHLKPDWVLSGINQGGNLGQDTIISAQWLPLAEATYHGVRAMALSHDIISSIAIDWDRIAHWTPRAAAGVASSAPGPTALGM